MPRRPLAVYTRAYGKPILLLGAFALFLWTLVRFGWYMLGGKI